MASLPHSSINGFRRSGCARPVTMAPCIDLVSDSSSDNSSDSSSGSELRHYKTCIHGIKQLALRGPDVKVKRYGYFDNYCEFGNHVELDHAQVAYLNSHCAKHRPTMPMYVCTLQKSHLMERKGKMYFTKNYTMTHLKRFITPATKLMVYCNEKEIDEVKIKVDKGRSKRAMLTSKWLVVVKNQKFNEGDVLVFWFRRVTPNRLKMIVKKIQPCPR